jgi:hypothetical protein
MSVSREVSARVVLANRGVGMGLVGDPHGTASGSIAFEAGARTAGCRDGVAGGVAAVVFGSSAISAVGQVELVQLGQILARSAPLHAALANDVLALGLVLGRTLVAIGQRLGQLGGRGRLPGHGGGWSFWLRMSICRGRRHGCFWCTAVVWRVTARNTCTGIALIGTRCVCVRSR